MTKQRLLDLVRYEFQDARQMKGANRPANIMEAQMTRNECVEKVVLKLLSKVPARQVRQALIKSGLTKAEAGIAEAFDNPDPM